MHYDPERLIPIRWFVRVELLEPMGKAAQKKARASALERALGLSGQLLGLRAVRVAEASDDEIETCCEARETMGLESGRTVAVRNVPLDCQREDVDRLFEGMGTRCGSTTMFSGGSRSGRHEADVSKLTHNATRGLGRFSRGERMSNRVALATFADAAEAERAVITRQGEFLGDFRVNLAVLH